MQTRIESSEFTRSQASSMIASISPESALRDSGRFMVTTSLWPILLDEAVRRLGTGAAQRWSWRGTLAKNENVF